MEGAEILRRVRERTSPQPLGLQPPGRGDRPSQLQGLSCGLENLQGWLGFGNMGIWLAVPFTCNSVGESCVGSPVAKS